MTLVLQKILSIMLGIILITTMTPSLILNSSGQESTFIPPRQQWKTISEIDELTCKEGLVLLQKNNGAPACVSPHTYLKLVDRGYGMFDSSIMMNRPAMINDLMQNMASTESLMQHWHLMMINDSSMMNKTITNWISQMKKNPEFLSNILGPMTSDPQIREQMVKQMRNHPQMENALQQNPKWMDAVHRMPSGMDSQMGHGPQQGMNQGMQMSECMWCSEYDHESYADHDMGFLNSDRVMDIIHTIWINPNLAQDMHDFMLQNPIHMANIVDQMMEPILELMMNDPEIRQQMMELMLENPELMDSIRHKNISVYYIWLPCENSNFHYSSTLLNFIS